MRDYSDDSDGTEGSSYGSTSGTESISVAMQREGPGSHSARGVRSARWPRPHFARKLSLDASILSRKSSASSLSGPGSPMSGPGSPLVQQQSADETEKEILHDDVDTPATTPEPEYEESILMETKPVKGKRAVRKDTVEPILQTHSAMAVWK